MYVIGRKAALKHLNDFIQNKLNKFGDGQDFVIDNTVVNFHSVLSPYLNVGVLTDRDILNVLKVIKTNKNNIRHIEAFFRQLCWRNYVCYLYLKSDQSFLGNLW
jgi:deoxyribodipyrimidine photolyase-related protein